MPSEIEPPTATELLQRQRYTHFTYVYFGDEVQLSSLFLRFEAENVLQMFLNGHGVEQLIQCTSCKPQEFADTYTCLLTWLCLVCFSVLVCLFEVVLLECITSSNISLRSKFDCQAKRVCYLVIKESVKLIGESQLKVILELRKRIDVSRSN